MIGSVIARFEAAGLSIVAMKMLRLSPSDAARFYGVHQGKPFFDSLVAFMTSGSVCALVLEGDNAIAKNRELMGATNPKSIARIYSR